jgi:hypothetical protein
MRQTEKQTNKQTDRPINRQISKHLDKTDRHSDIWIRHTESVMDTIHEEINNKTDHPSKRRHASHLLVFH